MSNTIQAVQFRCKSCNNVLHISADSPVLSCPCCGSSELIIENDSITIERIKSQTTLQQQQAANQLEINKLHVKERTENLKTTVNYKAMVAFLLFAVFFFGSMFLIASGFDFDDFINSFTNNIHVPMSSYECKKEYFEIVQMYFEDAGFISVTARPLTAPKDLSPDQIGLVKDIMINGDTDFYESDKFSSEAKVVIYYYWAPTENGISE